MTEHEAIEKLAALLWAYCEYSNPEALTHEEMIRRFNCQHPDARSLWLGRSNSISETIGVPSLVPELKLISDVEIYNAILDANDYRLLGGSKMGEGRSVAQAQLESIKRQIGT